MNLLATPPFEDVFSLFYVLPTFFNSDLDRGFSIIDYDLNDELVTRRDLDTGGRCARKGNEAGRGIDAPARALFDTVDSNSDTARFRFADCPGPCVGA